MNRNGLHPPRLARRIFDLFGRSDEQLTLPGDLDEIFLEMAASLSRGAARRWYWRQVLGSLAFLIKNSAVWSAIMFKHYLKFAWRTVRNSKGFAFINLSGLALGLTAVMLILIYVGYERSYDRYHEGADRIFRVVNRVSEQADYYQGRNIVALTPAPLGPAMVRDIPEIESAVRLAARSEVVLTVGEKSFIENNFFYADPEIFRIFSLTPVRGDSESLLTTHNTIVLSETAARKIFGLTDPVGKTLNFQSSLDLKVTGVFEDMPGNSHFRADYLVPFELFGTVNRLPLDNWGMAVFYTYVKLRPGASLPDVEAKLRGLIAKALSGEPWAGVYPLQPITSIHLGSDIIGEISANGSLQTVIILFSIAFLVLLIAGINYVNLSTARSTRRAREVGMRKVVGARRGQLIRQFLGESTAMAILAYVLALGAVLLVLPKFKVFVERDLSLSLSLAGAMFLVSLFIGLAAGSFPAMALSSFRPAAVIGGRFVRGRLGNRLRTVLVVVQFTISVFLIIATLVVRGQMNYVQSKDLGYSRDQTMVVTLRDSSLRTRIEALKEDLKRTSGVTAVAASDSLPNQIRSRGPVRWPGMPEDLDVSLYWGNVDYDFLELYGIHIVAGRNFSREFTSDAAGSVLLNQAAVKALGWENPLGREILHGEAHGGAVRGGTGKGTVVGIMKDFHSLSLHLQIAPMAYYLNPQASRFISIKIQGGAIPQTIEAIRSVFASFSPRYPFDYVFFDELFDRQYRAEQRMESLFGAFAVLAILIASMGLFGLAVFLTEQKAKEIGIRKVLGASVAGLIGWLIGRYARWVIAANVAAWPLAYFAMHQWLQRFAYRIDIGLPVFLMAGAASLAVAAATVGWQACTAAWTDPVKTLKYE